MAKKFLIIDGNSIVNRAFYGIRPLSTKDGLPTNAVYGFLNILYKHLCELSPDYAAIAYDLKAPTFRHTMYEGYKATRHAMPEELAVQLPYAKQCAEALGLHPLSLEGYEADDILGTLAAQVSEQGIDAYILTGDRDSLQLISDNTRILLCTNNDTVLMDTDAFFAKYGISPTQFVDVKALMGDTSDNIPGVAGVGEKTALKLISERGSLDKVYSDIASLSVGPSVKAKLEAGRENAYLSRTLARICTEVPLDCTLADCAYAGLQKEALYALFTQLEFSALIKRFGLEGSGEKAASLERKALNSDSVAALPTDCVYAALSDGERWYLCDGKVVYMTDFLPQNLSYCVCDAKAQCRATGMRSQIAFDLSLAGYLLNPVAGDYSLSRLTLSYLNCELPSEGADQAACMARLYPVLLSALEEQGQKDLFYRMELPLAFVLCDMEQEGFLVDLDELRVFGERLDGRIRECEEIIYQYAGRSFNINSPKQLGEILFEDLMLPSAKKTKTGYSTNAEVLEKLRPYHPIIDLILDYRQLSKLKGTYVEGLLRLSDAEGRVHTTFNQTVTATGRLSSTEPNLQNIPVRTELGREMRRFFCAREGYVLADADYSQIELRLLAHIADDQVMIQAFRQGADIHTATASQVFSVPIEAVTPAMRKSAKAVNFGIVYGIGDFSLAQDIGVSKKEAGMYIQSYMEKYAGIAAYLRDIVALARRDGYVTTLFGRRREIPELSSPKKMLQAFGERVAMNSPVQGSAADIIKLAMLGVDRALRESGLDARLILQVHDELIVEVRADQAAQAAAILEREMEQVTSLSVPLLAEVHTGKTWYDCK